MKTLVLALACLLGAHAAVGGDFYEEEYDCLPVNGFIDLPGIVYDDLTPLARQTFNGNTAAVTNALYALPFEEREDFIDLYLEPMAREKHRRFFARCREVSERRARSAVIDGKNILPERLRRELQERERMRLALHDGAIPFRIGDAIVYIPVPAGYAVKEGPVVALQDDGLADSLAVFEKTEGNRPDGTAPLVRRNLLATVKHVRQATDNLNAMVTAYRIMVDQDWRLTAMYPPDATPGGADSAEYRWNLEPFGVRDASFCYGQFEKTVDFHGVEQIRYRATAVIVLPGSYIQVSVMHLANTSLDVVNEINTDLTRWRDGILAANGK